MSLLFAPTFSLIDSPELRIAISFSGGKSSAELCDLIKRHFPLAQKVFAFMNTGEEAEPSLVFADQCDRYFDLRLAWLEAVVHQDMLKGSTHRVTCFEEASRHGEPYRAVVQKYGIANLAYLHCTRELKTNPFYSFMDGIWPRGTYWVALGMRSDEPDRIRENAHELRIWYPLAEAGYDKAEVNEKWADRPFNLNLKEEEGNCKWCFKKSDRKQIKLIQAHPDWYEFPAQLEKEFSLVNADAGNPRRIFRHNRTTEDMLRFARAFSDWRLMRERPDENSGCTESCEIEINGQQSLFGGAP